jgi:hypothetical protein
MNKTELQQYRSRCARWRATPDEGVRGSIRFVRGSSCSWRGGRLAGPAERSYAFNCLTALIFHSSRPETIRARRALLYVNANTASTLGPNPPRSSHWNESGPSCI